MIKQCPARRSPAGLFHNPASQWMLLLLAKKASAAASV
jgi:hypothetical protein